MQLVPTCLQGCSTAHILPFNIISLDMVELFLQVYSARLDIPLNIVIP